MDTTALSLADEIKARNAGGAAEKLANLQGAEIANELVHLSPAFAQDVLAALPSDARERTISAAPDDVARQWQRNALYEQGSVGRMMEPVIGAYPPDQSVGDTIESLRELVKMAFITYIYVVDRSERLLGIVTMRDLLFSEHNRKLSEVMLKDPFALKAEMPLAHPDHQGLLVSIHLGWTANCRQNGRAVRRWDRLHHYFGGVSCVGRAGAAGDPRRSGAAHVL